MTPEERTAQCANCEHPLSEHPPDSPCCPKCSGWAPKLEEIKAHVRLHGSIPGRYSHWLLSELDRVTAERDEAKREADALEDVNMNIAAQRDAALAQVERLRGVCEGFADTAERAVAHHENKGQGGQHVPFHGDFANILPSVVARLRWWARSFREALAATEPKR